METHSSTPLTSPRCLSSCVCCICDFSPMYCLRCLRPPAVAVVVVIQIRVARQALLLPLPHCDPRLASFDFHPIFPRRRGMEKKPLYSSRKQSRCRLVQQGSDTPLDIYPCFPTIISIYVSSKTPCVVSRLISCGFTSLLP